MDHEALVLWRDHLPAHDVGYEIAQIGEGEFELRVFCDGSVWLTEESSDWHSLLDRAREVRSDLAAQDSKP